MKYIAVLLLTLSAFASSANAQITETATDAVKNMGIGWNLGNTLDAYTCTTTDVSQSIYWGGQGLESEKCWGQPYTTKALITMMKNAGFGAIRIPTTWFNHMDESGNVNAQWMARVKEVVDFVIDNGLYCILNVHHDTGADNTNFTSWLKADVTYYNNNKARYEKLWQQIATKFKDYDNHLLFESYNEMLDTKNSWCFASFNTTGQYDATIASSAYSAINSYAQSFVNSVRATGGNNASRNLIVNTYCAANGYGTWNSHLKDPLTNMQKPSDSADGHIIFEVHDYPNLTETQSGSVVNRSISSIKSQINTTISGLKSNLPSGVPIIIGEWGTSNVDAGSGSTDYDVRRDLMFQFVNAYVTACKSNGIAPFYWMGLSDGKYRSMPAFNQADLAETMSKAYHGSDFDGEFPAPEQPSEYVVYEGEKAITNWSVQVTIGADLFAEIGKDVQLEITYKQTSSGGDIQLFYGDWSSKPTFLVGSRSFSGDLNPGSYYGTASGTEHTTVITFSSSVYQSLCSKGLVVFGDGWTMYKLRLVNPTTGIASVSSDVHVDDSYYSLSGQKVATPTHGIYIKGGKKILIR